MPVVTGIVAPAAMLPVWTMAGYRATVDAARAATNPNRGVFVALAEAGFTHTPGVNLTHRYARELHIGDRVHTEGAIAAVSEEKQTALGPAHFVDLQSRYHDDDGEPVGEQVLRVIAYDPTTERRPHSAATRDAPDDAGDAGDADEELPSARDHARSARCDRVHDGVQRLPRRSLRPRLARAIGMRDIFTDIPTSAGLAARFVTEWAGPNARLLELDVALGVPFCAGDTLTLTGTASPRADGSIMVSMRGHTDHGGHLRATAIVQSLA